MTRTRPSLKKYMLAAPTTIPVTQASAERKVAGRRSTLRRPKRSGAAMPSRRESGASMRPIHNKAVEDSSATCCRNSRAGGGRSKCQHGKSAAGSSIQELFAQRPQASRIVEQTLAALAEEWGFVGVATILTLYGLFLARGFALARGVCGVSR